MLTVINRKSLVLLGCVAGALAAGAVTPEELVEFPVSTNLRGHENIEWSTSYAFHLTDANKKLPRVLIVGDSIVGGYFARVMGELEGKASCTYWTSSYCVTSPCYLKFLSIYLDEAQYSVIHFNNGCHSFSTADADWEKGLRAALKLIRLKQPQAKIVWATTTPNGDAKNNARVIALNAIAAKVIAEFGGIAVDDLYALMNPLDRKTYWSDNYHFKKEAIDLQVKQVKTACLKALSGPVSVEFPIPESVQSWAAPEYDTNGVKAVWIEGVPWKGKATRVFAYCGLPAGASAGKKVPGIVLVHGGGGTAFHRWVKTWNARGYAAIAMDTCGGVPFDGEYSKCHTRHAWSGPNGWGCFADEGLKPEDQWMYHAVEAVLRAHTFLRSLPEVDVKRIGVTGISWGGVLTSVVCGVDPRFAFAAPVYGCGNLRRHSVWTPEIGVRWNDLWDPAQYAKRCRVPTLWCTGTNDHFFPLDSLKDTALSTGNALFSIKVRMRHGQWEGDPPEIAAFADSIVKGAPKLTERKVVRREWVSTDSNDPIWEKRFFTASPNVPVNSTIRFENRVLEGGLVLSSEPVFAARGPQRPVLAKPDAAHVWSTRKHEGIPAVAVSPTSGRLWATWFGGPTDCEDSNNYVILATSADRGKTWKQVLVCDPDGAGPLRAFDPQVWVAPDGKLRWTWAERKVPLREGENFRNSCLDWFGLPRRLCSVTLDADNEPAEPYPELERIATGVMLGKPLVRSDGAWLYPISEWFDDLSGRVYVTKDQGKTFDLLGGVTVPIPNREFEEHNLVELKDGTLRMYMRVQNSGSHCTWQAESKDGGRTWSKPGPCSFLQTSSRRFVRRLANGALLLVKNGPLDKDVGRNDMRAYVSDDDGQTWKGGLLLHKGYCTYPDGDQAPDGSIYVIYDTERTGNRVNSLARFTEADVRAGKVVSAGSDLGLKVDVR